MIKTVSLAPPRATSGSRKSSKPQRASGSSASNSAPPRAAKTRAASDEAPAETNARAAITHAKSAEIAPAKLKASVPRASAPKASAPKASAPKVSAPDAANATTAEGKSAKSKSAEAVKRMDAPVAKASASGHLVKPVAKAPGARESFAKTPAQKAVAASAAIAIKSNAKPAKIASPTAPKQSQNSPEPPKVKRARVPKDLAQQYGAATEDSPRRIVEPSASAPRKRLTKAKREARAQLLQLDDDLLQRLERAGEVARPTPKRARGWEFECGRCGRVTTFQTPGALCECGAIAVRE